MELNDKKRSLYKKIYDLEVMLSNKLNTASKENRLNLYNEVYDEYYNLINKYSFTFSNDSKRNQSDINNQISIIKKFCKKDTVFLEIGPGKGEVCKNVSNFSKNVFALDTTSVYFDGKNNKQKLLIYDGINMPFNNCIDIIYSHQLMEHLHPDDAKEQLENIYKSLKIGGKYICITPHYLSGPHDISKYFSSTANGLHLKEYSIIELYNIFKDVGFKKIKLIIGGKGKYISISILPIILIETIISYLPRFIQKIISSNIIMRNILGIRFVAFKN